MRTLGNLMYVVIGIYFHAMVRTDWFDGWKDPQGPYPRIPDKEKLEKEIEFAKECRKHIFPPKDLLF